jgi:hypothetical protein
MTIINSFYHKFNLLTHTDPSSFGIAKGRKKSLVSPFPTISVYSESFQLWYKTYGDRFSGNDGVRKENWFRSDLEFRKMFFEFPRTKAALFR